MARRRVDKTAEKRPDLTRFCSQPVDIDINRHQLQRQQFSSIKSGKGPSLASIARRPCLWELTHFCSQTRGRGGRCSFSVPLYHWWILHSSKTISNLTSTVVILCYAQRSNERMRPTSGWNVMVGLCFCAAPWLCPHQRGGAGEKRVTNDLPRCLAALHCGILQYCRRRWPRLYFHVSPLNVGDGERHLRSV